MIWVGGGDSDSTGSGDGTRPVIERALQRGGRGATVSPVGRLIHTVVVVPPTYGSEVGRGRVAGQT
jgi:hypothetical protein